MPKLTLLRYSQGALLLVASAIGLPAQTLTTLVNFNGTNGAHPQSSSLAQGTDGKFYGTTYQGGAFGYGTVFSVTAAGTLTILHSFNGADGAHPYAGVILAADGAFHGTTYGGGAHGLGTIFKITLTGSLTTIYSFDAAHGAGPACALVQAIDGSFWGTTQQGGIYSRGAIFQASASGVVNRYSFGVASGDGSNPNAGLLQATGGNFYGTTPYGGVNGFGTVFEITPTGVFHTLHSFVNTDGANPYAGLIQASNGYLYGTTTNVFQNYGTIFRISPAGALETLHVFNFADGGHPYDALTQATDGNFYGTTSVGGYEPPFERDGTAFQFMPAGALTLLSSFNSTNGANPDGSMLQATDGNFYGTTNEGGTSGYPGDGTVFKVSMGFGPFVEAVPSWGKTGAVVRILGNSLTGTSSVSFNGTAASFTVNSATHLTATVPAGASSGTVQVTTPDGTLLSNVSFQVMP